MGALPWEICSACASFAQAEHESVSSGWGRPGISPRSLVSTQYERTRSEYSDRLPARGRRYVACSAGCARVHCAVVWLGNLTVVVLASHLTLRATQSRLSPRVARTIGLYNSHSQPNSRSRSPSLPTSSLSREHMSSQANGMWSCSKGALLFNDPFLDALAPIQWDNCSC